MLIDIIRPDGNEQHFFEMAKKLGYDSLILLYESKKAQQVAPYFANLLEKAKEYNIVISFASDQRSNAFAKYSLDPLIIVSAGENSRSHFESKATSIVYDLECTGKKEFIHHRNSGLNHVLCNLAKEKNIWIGFSIHSLLSSDIQTRSLLIGRMRQNARFCNKFDLPCILASFASDPYHMRSPHDLASFCSFLGLRSSLQKKEL